MADLWRSNEELENRSETGSTIDTRWRGSARVCGGAAYLCTAPGLLKLIQIVTSITGVACVECSKLSMAKLGLFRAIGVTGLLVTTFLMILYLRRVVEELHMVPWLKIEFGFCLVWTAMWLLASTAAVTSFTYSYGGGLLVDSDVLNEPGQLTAGGISGYLASIFYAIDAVTKFNSLKICRNCCLE